MNKERRKTIRGHGFYEALVLTPNTVFAEWFYFGNIVLHMFLVLFFRFNTDYQSFLIAYLLQVVDAEQLGVILLVLAAIAFRGLVVHDYLGRYLNLIANIAGLLAYAGAILRYDHPPRIGAAYMFVLGAVFAFLVAVKIRYIDDLYYREKKDNNA